MATPDPSPSLAVAARRAAARHAYHREPRCQPCLNADPLNCQRPPRTTAAPCGTVAAAHAHRRRGEPPCPLCVAARRAAARHAYHREPRCQPCLNADPLNCQRPPRTTAAPCGTVAAAHAHRRRGEPPCPLCVAARRAAARHAYHREPRCQPCLNADPLNCQRPPRTTAAPCGTVAAAHAHRRRGEPPCPLCVAARRAAARHAYHREPRCQPCLNADPLNCQRPSRRVLPYKRGGSAIADDVPSRI